MPKSSDSSAASTPFAGRVLRGAASARAVLDGESFLNFYGAGYLALSGIPDIREVVERAVREGVPYSRQWVHVSGAVDPSFTAIEERGARAFGTETSVYLPTGSLIGAAGMAALHGEFDAIFIDEIAHFNLRVAAKATSLPLHEFPHCDAVVLANLLSAKLGSGVRPLIVSDGVFPTTGRIPPLAEYSRLARQHGGTTFIDDAHGFGAIGPDGRGAAAHCGTRVLSGVTMSKAYCAQGALIGCTADQARRIRQAPLVRGANSGSPLSALAAAAAFDYLEKHPGAREQLSANTAYCREVLREVGMSILDSPAPIVSFALASRPEMIALQKQAFENGIVLHLSNYIGASGDGLIRCAIFRDHTRLDFDRLAQFVGKFVSGSI